MAFGTSDVGEIYYVICYKSNVENWNKRLMFLFLADFLSDTGNVLPKARWNKRLMFLFLADFLSDTGNVLPEARWNKLSMILFLTDFLSDTGNVLSEARWNKCFCEDVLPRNVLF